MLPLFFSVLKIAYDKVLAAYPQITDAHEHSCLT